MVPADSSKMTVLPLLGAVTDATFRPDPLSLSSTLIVKATSSLVLAASLIAVAACTAEGITRSCTRNRTISILARTHEYQSLFPTFHLFTKSPWSLMISQCQATFPSEYSSHFVSHCKSIRDCYTLGRSRFCNSVTLWNRPKSVTPQHMDSPACARMTEGLAGRTEMGSPPGSGLSYGLFQESKEVSTDDLDHISFAISPGQEFCRKFYGVVVSFYAIVLPIGPGLREVCHLVTEVKTKPNVVNPYQVANMIDMVGHVFLVQFLFVGVPNKDTEGIHSHDPIARRQFADQIVCEISHGGNQSPAVRVRGHDGPVIEME